MYLRDRLASFHSYNFFSYKSNEATISGCFLRKCSAEVFGLEQNNMQNNYRIVSDSDVAKHGLFVCLFVCFKNPSTFCFFFIRHFICHWMCIFTLLKPKKQLIQSEQYSFCCFFLKSIEQSSAFATGKKQKQK